MVTQHSEAVVPEPSREATGTRKSRRPCVALVARSTSYRIADFVSAAKALRLEVVLGTDAASPVVDIGPLRIVQVDFDRPEWSAARMARVAPTPDAFVAVDDDGGEIAVAASHLAGTPANSIAATAATTDKSKLRRLLEQAGVPQPDFIVAPTGKAAEAVIRLGLPCVIKPLSLSASVGVIRVDTVAEAIAAEERIHGILERLGESCDGDLLVERFVPGPEVAVEALLVDGDLTVLAVFDKPDQVDGPYFEETILITPSRLDDDTSALVASTVQKATSALGLVTGPIHAEVRIDSAGPQIIEVAARSIGGLCSRTLSFSALSESLESLILRSALGLAGPLAGSTTSVAGVMMLPVPTAGTLVGIEGVEDALSVRGIESFEQTIVNGRQVLPLPEGDRYLAFLFAIAETPSDVEDALRSASDLLTITVDGPTSSH